MTVARKGERVPLQSAIDAAWINSDEGKAVIAKQAVEFAGTPFAEFLSGGGGEAHPLADRVRIDWAEEAYTGG